MVGLVVLCGICDQNALFPFHTWAAGYIRTGAYGNHDDSQRGLWQMACSAWIRWLMPVLPLGFFPMGRCGNDPRSDRDHLCLAGGHPPG